MKEFFVRRAAASLAALLALCLFLAPALTLSARAEESLATPPAAAGDRADAGADAGASVVPEPASQPEETPVPPPVVLITRDEMADLAAGGEREIVLRFQNLGQTTLKTPIASLTPSEGLRLAGGASSFVVEEIPAGEMRAIRVKLQAAASATAAQSLSVELRFNYQSAGALTAGTASDRLNIPVREKAAGQPLVYISRSDVTSPIVPGETFSLAVTFRNDGTAAVKGAAATVTPSEGLVLLDKASTFPVGDIGPGKTGSITVQLQGAREITSAAQSLSVELRYSYDGASAAASASERLNIPAKAAAAASADVSVPNIVVQKFDYGGKPVAAGGDFPLSFTFENTGAVGVENIVATVDGGECFTVSGGTNTAHYKALGPGKTLTQELPMQAVANCKSGAQGITVSFKYEYLDGAKRAPVTADVRLSVPVTQPDRFQVNAPIQPAECRAGQEAELTLSYVNKGRADIGNLEARLVGEGFESPALAQYLGNVAAGASGTVGFALTPQAAGPLALTVRISYEDADLVTQTKEFPLTLEVGEEEEPVDFGEELPEKAPLPGWLPAVGGALALAAAAVVIWQVWRRKQAAAHSAPAACWTWADEAEEDLPAGGEE